MGIAANILHLTRPDEHADLETGAGQRTLGVVAAVVGWALVGLGLLSSLSSAALVAAGGSAANLAAQQALSLGIAVAGLGTAKTGIALVLWGIVRRIWVRFDSVRAALPALKARVSVGTVTYGEIATPHGRAKVTAEPRPSILIHRLARVLWLPMLAMGLMALFLGLLVSFAESGSYAADAATARSLKAWVQGLQFLGEGLVLSAISFLLGTILGAIRDGGGQTQHAVGAPVKTLVMPFTSWIFIVLMALGMMIEVVQFLIYAYVSTLADAQSVRTAFAWLGPFREFGLGVLLAGITFALVTIARVLRFQFDRVVEIIRTGR